MTAMLTKLDSPTRRHLVDELLENVDRPPLWLVTCGLSRQEKFGTVALQTQCWVHAPNAAAARDEAVARLRQQRPGYTADVVTAVPAEAAAG